MTRKTSRWDAADTLETKEDIAAYLDAVLEDRDLVSADDVRARRASERPHERLGIARYLRYGDDRGFAVRLSVHARRDVHEDSRGNYDQGDDDCEDHRIQTATCSANAQVSVSTSSCAAAGTSNVNTLPPPGLSA